MDGSNPHKVGNIGPLPPDIWGYDVSPTNQISLHEIERQPARAVAGELEVGSPTAIV